jgi:hypothetical protein
VCENVVFEPSTAFDAVISLRVDDCVAFLPIATFKPEE